MRWMSVSFLLNVASRRVTLYCAWLVGTRTIMDRFRLDNAQKHGFNTIRFDSIRNDTKRIDHIKPHHIMIRFIRHKNLRSFSSESPRSKVISTISCRR
mmetsp:Transcript_5190/g.10692  ORF Transcript_5190/g.10692 Transcript_5190/m.10692 type:complete len:98 (-) Transcript_5190:552-845(-)